MPGSTVLTEAQSAWLFAVIVTLMVSCWLMTRIPRCSHAECDTAHKDASAREAKARTAADLERFHAYHDRFRPQPLCALCQATKRDDPEP
jgi:hypothetical protein